MLKKVTIDGALLVFLLVGLVIGCIFWPGFAEYDSVVQYREALSGQLDDWHPPAMSRLWQLLHWAFGGGAQPMFVIQLGFYFTGLGLLAQALASTGRWRSAIATMMLSLSPVVLGWEVVVLKDGQMLGALTAAIGIVGYFNLKQRPAPWWSKIVVAFLIGYATFVRSNAIFATAPLMMLLVLKRPNLWAIPLIASSTLLVIVVTPLVNASLFQAVHANAERSQLVFDLAGIAAHTAPKKGEAILTPSEHAQIINQHCYKPFFWDAMLQPGLCEMITRRVQQIETSELFAGLVRGIVAHPAAYLIHRIRHWNQSERWLVPLNLPLAVADVTNEPNDLGLVAPSNLFVPFLRTMAAIEMRTPLGWPIFWTMLAPFALLLALSRRGSPNGHLALALAASAIGQEASFLVISVASDLRYHIWPMTATGLAIILLVDGTRLSRRILTLAALVLVGIVVAGSFARIMLPEGPSGYHDMMVSAD